MHCMHGETQKKKRTALDSAGFGYGSLLLCAARMEMAGVLHSTGWILPPTMELPDEEQT